MKEINLKTKNATITYYLIQRKNMKNIHIRVKEDLKVYVSAPYLAPMNFIDAFVLKKLAWIERTRQTIKEQNESKNKIEEKKSLEEKELFIFLGQRYKTKRINSEDSFISPKNSEILIYAPNEEKAESLLDKYFRENALKLSYKLLKEKRTVLLAVGLTEYPEIKLRKMKARWGSCYYKKGKIVLNTELFKYPLKCVEFVLLHELCHFKEPNHSKAFYSLLTDFMPDWKNADKMLYKK